MHYCKCIDDHHVVKVQLVHRWLKLIFTQMPACRRGLAIGSTGTFPGGLAADLACCPVFFFIYYYYFFYYFTNVPKWSFPIVAFHNKSIINHKSVSLDWQHRASSLFLASVKRFWTESMRWTRWRRGNGQKKQLNVAKLATNLFRASSAGQFHL